jgi:hypothetical protein
MYADAQAETLFAGHHAVKHPAFALDGQGCTGCVDGARKFCEKRIAGEVCKPATMFAHKALDDAALRLYRGDRGFLIPAHEQAVAGHVGVQDGGEAMYGRSVHIGQRDKLPGRVLRAMAMSRRHRPAGVCGEQAICILSG